jgi:hypothetical protein
MPLTWFERHQDDIDPVDCRKNSERFSRPRFEREFKEFVESKWEEFKANRSF